MGDRSVAQSASVAQRYNGLIGIVKDVFLLAECDFVVCTFSSQVKVFFFIIVQSYFNICTYLQPFAQYYYF